MSEKYLFNFGKPSGLLLGNEKGLLTPTMGKCYIWAEKPQ